MRKQIRMTNISFEVLMLEYLKEMTSREDRDRSYIVNQVIREHATRHGQTLRPAREPSVSRGEDFPCR